MLFCIPSVNYYLFFHIGQFLALSWETHIDSGNCAAVLPSGEMEFAMLFCMQVFIKTPVELYYRLLLMFSGGEKGPCTYIQIMKYGIMRKFNQRVFNCYFRTICFLPLCYIKLKSWKKEQN